MSGRVAACEASEDPDVRADLPSHFKFGEPVHVRVVGLKGAESKQKLALSLRAEGPRPDTLATRTLCSIIVVQGKTDSHLTVQCTARSPCAT